jgi:putative ABC transport system ATP-binding protein
MADTATVFRARGLTKVYRMGEVEVHALRGIDLEFRAGELVVLLGPSGSGKSTLLNILGGLDVPRRGGVLPGRNPRPPRGGPDPVPPRSRGLRVPVLQSDPQPDGARERGAVTETSATSHATRRRPWPWWGWRARWTTSRPSSPAASSSAWPSPAPSPRRPHVLLCDEPTGALDSATGVIVLEALEKVNRELGTTHRADHPQRRHRRHGRPGDPAVRRAHRRGTAQCGEAGGQGVELVM